LPKGLSLQIAKLIPPEASGRYSRHQHDPPLPETVSSNETEAPPPPPPPATRTNFDDNVGDNASLASAATPLSDAALRADVAEAPADADNAQPVARPEPNVWQSNAGVFTCAFEPHASEDSGDGRGHSVAHRAKRFQGVAAVLLALSFRWTLQQMAAMAKGLLLSHRVNVVHGDVSLNNYLWGDGGRLKLMDFDRAADVRSHQM
jgi:hypothetical protein